MLSEFNSESESNVPLNNDCESTSKPGESDEESRISKKMETASTCSSKSTKGREKIDLNLKSLQLVWAKCRGYPWYPALIMDPDTPEGYVHNNVPLPCPPKHVLELQKNHTESVFLVLFFDVKRTWQWLPPSKLELLGIDKFLDEAKLSESKKPQERKQVKKAYQEALHYSLQVTRLKPEGKL
jgi:bromodomain and PHD finger-containing protein 1